jgi:ribosomal protein S27E
MTPEKKAAQFPCPGCAADMQFDPATGGMKCPFCGATQAIAAPAGGDSVPSHGFHEFVAAGAEKLQPLTGQALEVSCDGCGSVVTFEPPEVAGICPFCGAALVAQAKAADPLIAPDALLPAKVPKEQATAEIKQWLQSRWFAPNALTRFARPEGINGVYLPFWDYNADTASRYTGERGQHYWETEYYTENDGNGNAVQRERQVQRTNWYPCAGEVTRHFDGVLVAATKAVNEARLSALEPWDLESMRRYEPMYLSGFKAQRYQLELPDGFEKAKGVMQVTIAEDVRHNIGGDEQRIYDVQTEYANVMFRHLLLPVWIGAYRFRDKVYQVAVNARTGEVQGERPYSTAKIAALVAAIILLIVVWIVLKSSHG